jgi:rubredoxin
MCPECGSDQVTIQEFDFGICPQTGYHDAGARFRCQACGAKGDADDLEPARRPEILGSFLAENAGALHDGTISLASALKVGRQARSSGRRIAIFGISEDAVANQGASD